MGQFLYNPAAFKVATVAQLAEQTIRNRQVVGSYPTGGSVPVSWRQGSLTFQIS